MSHVLGNANRWVVNKSARDVRKPMAEVQGFSALVEGLLRQLLNVDGIFIIVQAGVWPPLLLRLLRSLFLWRRELWEITASCLAAGSSHPVNCCCWSLIALFSALDETHCAIVTWDSKWTTRLFIVRFEYPLKWCTYSTVWLLHGWCHVKLAAILACSVYNHTTMHHHVMSLHAKPHT